LRTEGSCSPPGKEISLFTLNPLDAHMTDDVMEHICLVTDIFSDIFNFTPPQSWMFLECLKRLYQDIKGDERALTLSMMAEEVERAPQRSTYDIETKLALLRRIKPLTSGQASRALDGPSTMGVEDVFERVVSVKLGHFKEMKIRKIFVQILLKLLYDLRMRGMARDLRHVTIIEEARNVIPIRPANMPPSIGKGVVSELRKFGEGLIIVSQFPTHISQEILKNAGTRIFHAIRSEDDRRVVQGSLNLSEEQASHMHFLKPGEAMIKVPNTDSAFLAYVNPIEPMPTLSNEVLKRIMDERFHGNFIQIETVEAPAILRVKLQTTLYGMIGKGGEVEERALINAVRKEMGDLTEIDMVQVLDGMVRREIVVKRVDAKGNCFYRGLDL